MLYNANELEPHLALQLTELAVRLSHDRSGLTTDEDAGKLAVPGEDTRIFATFRDFVPGEDSRFPRGGGPTLTAKFQQ